MITSLVCTVLTWFFILVIFLVFGWYIYVKTFSKHLKNIPGPKLIPIFGNALMFKDSTDTLRVIGETLKDHGKIIRFWIGLEVLIYFADYKYLEALLSSTKILDKSTMYRHLHSWLGNGLLTSGGTKWKQRRKLLTPTYHFQILDQFVPIFNKVSTNLIRELEKIEDKSKVDIHPFISLATLDIICETAMGVPINALQDKKSSYVHSVLEMGRIMMERVFSPIQQFECLFQYTQNGRTQKECLKILHGHTTEVIRKRREELAKQSNDKNTNDLGQKKRVAFLDMLLQATINGQPLSDDDIREEVDTFMFEGHDTTSSGISFTLFEIANNLNVQEKILVEQEEIFGIEDRDPSYQDLTNMKYLEMVIKEGLRMYPPVPSYGRTSNEDVHLTGDIWCPKGSTVAISAFHMHRDPEFFPEPNTFNPERFSAENYNGKFPYSYVPFSAGSRNCIGQKFAMLELKSMISKIMRNFHLEPIVPAHQLELLAEITLKSRNGILIKLSTRN